MDTELGVLKYGIGEIEKKQLWNEIKKQLKPYGFKLRTKTTLIKDFPETIVMLQLQTSCYDSVDYYINIACTVKCLNNNPSPLFDMDRMNFVRIRDKGSVKECIDDILFYTDGFSDLKKLRDITLSDICIYNSTSHELLEHLGI